MIPISEGGERREGGKVGGGEFILSGRDCARPRYHSSVAKLLLFHFSSYFFPFLLIFPGQLSLSLRIENNVREKEQLQPHHRRQDSGESDDGNDDGNLLSS